MVEQEAMHEDIPSANLAQKNTLRGIIEKTCIVERDILCTPEQEAQHKMLQTGRPAAVQSDGQSRDGPIDQPPKQGMQCPELLPGGWGKPKEMAHDAHCRVICAERLDRTAQMRG